MRVALTPAGSALRAMAEVIPRPLAELIGAPAAEIVALRDQLTEIRNRINAAL